MKYFVIRKCIIFQEHFTKFLDFWNTKNFIHNNLITHFLVIGENDILNRCRKANSIFGERLNYAQREYAVAAIK